ncbi:MAG TPA: aspartyl protease family protein [Terracidiphilus sp.]|jgi:predicted aspartyl protease|nr:aspartyl protease family protein [Terracidiphilus sp.]
MNLKHKLTYLAALVALSLPLPPAISCSDEGAQFHSSIWSSKERVVVPFEFINNQIVVRLSLNGMPGNFIVDTGTDHTALDRRAADAAHMKDAAHLTIVPNTGNANSLGKSCAIVVAARGVEIKFGKVELIRGITPVSDFSQFEKGFGFTLSGIIGFDYIRQFPMLFDYRAKTITIFGDKRVQYRGPGTSIPLVDTNPPVVAAKMELPDGSQAEAKLIVDTGYYGGLDLHGPFVQKHVAVQATQNTARSDPAPGIRGGCGDDIEQMRGEVSAIQLGTARFPGPETQYAKSPIGVSASSETDGQLGSAFLSQFRIFFDAPRNLIVLDR